MHSFKLPENVNFIIHTLMEHGFEGYAVGGCVRDTLLGRIPQDWDITTSARPEQVKELFSHTIDTGIQHGTVTVMLDHEGYEVTTYRIDGEYEDARHPKEVTFTANLIEDLKRRDFTINAMAYNETAGLVDAFDGIGDLNRKVIRCVGDPMERFSEDALRMLRAVRFAAQLGFEIAPDTKAAVSRLADNIQRVSAERIQVELVKLLVSGHPEEIRQVYELGLSAWVLPEFDRMMQTPQRNIHHCYSVGEHTIHALMQIRADKVLRLTMLFHDVAKPLCITADDNGEEHYHGHPKMGADMTRQILRRLKFDNDTIDRTAKLVAAHDERPPLTEKAIRKAVSRTGLEQYPQLFEVKRADTLAQSAYQREEKLAYIAGYEAIYQDILRKNQCLQKKDLSVNGRDLIAYGMKPGKQMGEILNQLFEAVLEQPELNDREKLLQLAHKFADPFI